MAIAFEKKGHTSCLLRNPITVCNLLTASASSRGERLHTYQEMSESRAELVAALHPAGMQIRRMGQTLPHYWMDASAYQKLLYIVGTVLLVQNASKVEVDPFANQLVLLGQLYRQLLSPLFFFYNE